MDQGLQHSYQQQISGHSKVDTSTGLNLVSEIPVALQTLLEEGSTLSLPPLFVLHVPSSCQPTRLELFNLDADERLSFDTWDDLASYLRGLISLRK